MEFKFFFFNNFNLMIIFIFMSQGQSSLKLFSLEFHLNLHTTCGSRKSLLPPTDGSLEILLEKESIKCKL